MATGVFVLAALGLGLVENLELQIIAFIAWAAGRQFLFSTFFAFMLEKFGPLFGRVTGIGGLLAGVFCYLQNPLLQLTLEKFNGDWHPVEYVQIGLTLSGCLLLVANRWCWPGTREAQPAVTAVPARSGMDSKGGASDAAAAPAVEAYEIELALDARE
jgi:hypothetical protein